MLAVSRRTEVYRFGPHVTYTAATQSRGGDNNRSTTELKLEVRFDLDLNAHKFVEAIDTAELAVKDTPISSDK